MAQITLNSSGVASNGSLVLQSNGTTTAVTIDTSQNVGVGTSSPSYPLHVVKNAAGAQKVYFSNNNSGSSAETAFSVSNGTAEGSLRVAGGSYSGYGAYTANNTLIYNDTSAITLMADNASNGIIKFATGSNSERARIDTSGYSKFSNNGSYTNLSGTYHELNNSNANYVCVVRNSSSNPSGIDSYFSAVAPNGTGNTFYYAEDSAAQRFAVRSNGGIANYSANDVNLSDRREKTNFAPAGDYLAKICAIPVQTFTYIDQNLEEDGGLTLGVVAQDVQAVAPELVMESNWAKSDEEPKMRLSIYQTDLQYALMKCIQEQQAIISALTARIEALES